MKLSHACGVTQDRRVMVERSDRMWSTGEGNGKPLQYSCLKNPMNSIKRQNGKILKGELPGSVVPSKLLETSGEITPERMNGWSQSKNNTQLWMGLMIEARFAAIRVICIGTWNVRSMNQGKLEVVKEEMARVNIEIPGISELRWTGMGELNSADHYTYYCGQESLRRNGVAIMVNKGV